MKRWIKKLVPREWNRRIHTWIDFEYYCLLEIIEIFLTPLDQPGFFIQLPDGRRQIYINADLPKIEQLRVGFHELGHVWLHEPCAQFFIGMHAKMEREADLVAAVALIPQWLLLSLSPGKIAEDYGYPADLIRFRLEVYESHRI